MGIRSTIRAMFPGQQAQPVAAAPVEVAPDQRGAPGTRVYHEYFLVDEANGDGKWPWKARVYAANGAPNEQTGLADTQELARNAALAWCAKTKAILRGE
ncbi:hypothetical protein [Massilia sp. ZL223]|uniref:hypothetical protein n=1 Tax=Massilia sp. ZL223 TaxID=2824904 RepID=UPI001B822D03|nr:hypothetical protein [Massilia sp. ZL223]MBQ5963151.1 hypothetical protein [Massilia sp. ZL223]